MYMQRVQAPRKIKILVSNFCKCILCIILKHSEYKWIKLINHYSTTFAGKADIDSTAFYS